MSITFDLPTAELAAECLTHILPFAKLDLEHLYVDVLCMCPPSRRGSSYKDDPLTEHKKKKSGEILYSPSLYKEYVPILSLFGEPNLPPGVGRRPNAK